MKVTNTKNLSDGDKDMEKILKRLEDCSEDEYKNQNPSYYSINYLEAESNDYLYVYVVKNEVDLKSSNKDNDQDIFDDLTFTITASNS